MHSHSSQERQDNHLVVGVTGYIGAGKTSATKYLCEVHGFHYVRYSQVLSEWLAKDSDDKDRLQTVGWDVMGGGMQAELNARLIAQIPAQSNCAVDGLRHPVDFDSLTKSFPQHFYLLYIDSAQEIRWQRRRSRFPQFEDFKRADSHPVEQQIEALRGKAFRVINNDKSLQDLYIKVDSLLEKMQQGGQR
jgi:dephospho-CoA kinase